MNKKQTIIAALTTTIVGLTVGAGTAGVRYFKKDGNRERFLQNETIQKVRKTSNRIFTQVKNGQVKLQTFVSNFKNDLEEADKNADKQEIIVLTEAETPAIKNEEKKPSVAKVEEIKTENELSVSKNKKDNHQKRA